MNTKLKPPCLVLIDGVGKPIALRRISPANSMLKRQGWKGLVGHVQNTNGSGIVEYRRLKPVPK